MSDYGVKFCLAYISTNNGSVPWRQVERFSELTIMLCSGSFKYAFAVAKAPALVSNTNSPTLQNLDARSIIRSTEFCWGWSVIFCSELSGTALDTSFSEEISGMFFIVSVHQVWVVATLPWPPQSTWGKNLPICSSSLRMDGHFYREGMHRANCGSCLLITSYSTISIMRKFPPKNLLQLYTFVLLVFSISLFRIFPITDSHLLLFQKKSLIPEHIL